MVERTLADRFPNFPSFWQFISKKNPSFITTNPYKEQLTAQWFAGVHYYHRQHSSYWPAEEDFISRFSAVIYAQYASICKKEKLYQQIYPRLNTLWKVKTTSRTTNRGDNKRVMETIDKPLFESPDYLVSNYGIHGRSNLVKNTVTTTEKTHNDTGSIANNKLLYNFSETEDRRGISQVLGHFRELDTIVQDFLNAKEIKILFLFIKPVPKIAYIFDPLTKKKRIVTEEEEEQETQEEETKKDKALPAEEEDDLTLPTTERLLRFKKKQERLKKLQMGIVQGKIALRIEHIDRFYEAFSSEIKMPPLGNPNDRLPSRGRMTNKEWKENVLDKVSFWAKINQVTGFEEIKEKLARVVKLYEESVRLKKEMNQIMLLLCSKPGVGKTFVATIIAQTLNRPLIIVSMNGKKNTNTFTGVEQEVPGCNVGEILKAMSASKHRAPVILLDEFEKCDKMVQQSLGNPTDKSINKAFADKFFELPIPINEVIFIGTANYLEQIEPFILSRLLPIELKPLSLNDRIKIAQERIKEEFAGWDMENLVSKVSERFIKRMINEYKEWGVRKLKDNIADLAEQVKALALDGDLPDNFDNYPWKLVKGEEIDTKNGCFHAKVRANKHIKNCDCFNGKEIEGWENEFGEFKFEIRQ